MRERKIVGLMVVAALSGLLCAVGLGWTLYDYFGPASAEALDQAKPPAGAVPGASSTPTSPAAPASPSPGSGTATPPAASQKSGFHVAVIGDSLARGTGDPDGKGFAGYLLDDLKQRIPQGQGIVLDNFGVDGQTSAQLSTALQQQAPLQGKVAEADVIVVSIGANDLFRGGDTLRDLSAANIQSIESGYLGRLDGILKQLRQRNANAKIFLIGLYNPFIDFKDTTAVTTKIVRDWNYKAAEVAAQTTQTVLVPTFDLFQLKVQDYLARDLFHPNAAGYRLIGERVAALITW
ncbi:GDSL-type esterase/lipase family protein [Paenibacillus koleovorans]|uniref:GDSL-type esterase/lipase family protein n=1 Tax=Paenibacillus koleovorans TaxID=121608 RepID=UPI000FD9024F|nr:GDSL-type esterase/lipase family protein [Paenibacillus koleovorans]